MSGDVDPHCPECGEPIGQTATYCMHCSADLTEEQAAADSDADEAWESTGTGGESGGAKAAGGTAFSDAEAAGGTAFSDAEDGGVTGQAADALGVAGVSDDVPEGQYLDPDGLVDDTLTVAVGIAGGLFVGFVGTIVLGVVTASGLALPFGLLVWLGATAYLVRRRTVQEAVSKTGYATATVLLLTPLIAVSPAVDGGLAARGQLFVVLLVFVFVPAAIAAVIGLVAAQFVPDETGGSAN